MGRSGGMGGGGGGGLMFRTLGRPTTAASASKALASSSSSSSPTRSAYSTLNHKSRSLSLSLDPSSSFFSSYPIFDDDDDDFVLVGGTDDDGYSDLAAAPSLDEVRFAVSALQQVSPVGSELDWMEPTLHLSDSRILQHNGYDRVFDAFHLLQTDPCVQRMVVSLSSDKEVWNAVLRNEVVQELRQAFRAAEVNGRSSSDQNTNNSIPAGDFLSWIFYGTKEKVRDVIEKISKLVSLLFPPAGNEETAENSSSFDLLVDAAYMLCVVVMLVVVVGRTINRHES